MSGKKVSRNAPCPCGSGKKFKHCCLAKGIDWEARQAGGARRMLPGAPRPRPAAPHGLAALGPFRVIDARLKQIAGATQGPADWKSLVEGLSDETPDAERIRAYKAVREAGVLSADAAFFLFGHAVQWMPSGEGDLDWQTLAALRRFGWTTWPSCTPATGWRTTVATSGAGSSSSARPTRCSPNACGRRGSSTDRPTFGGPRGHPRRPSRGGLAWRNPDVFHRIFTALCQGQCSGGPSRPSENSRSGWTRKWGAGHVLSHVFK
jgi:hypothetical protein